MHVPCKPWKPDQFLLIFEDELRAIFCEMDVIHRPQVLNNYDGLTAERYVFDISEEEMTEWLDRGCLAMDGAFGEIDHLHTWIPWPNSELSDGDDDGGSQ